jgi:hypothetical protein
MRHTPMLVLSVLGLGLLDCQTRFDRPASLVDQIRVLAIVLDPPETVPTGRVRAEVLVTGPNGRVTEPAPNWSLCVRGPELAAYNSVADACALPSEGALEYLGVGFALDLVVPSSACSSFGSETPPSGRDGRLIRPVDPDATGGYFQPVRIDVGAAVAFGGPRLSCALPRASADVVRTFRERYLPNRNPVMLPLELPPTAPRGSRLTVVVRVAEGSRERYVVYDPRTGTLADRTEVIDARFFTTAGSFSSDATSGDGELVDELTLPDAPERVSVWVVVRDERGGAAFREAVVDVR